MMEPLNNDLSGVSEASVGLVNSEESRGPLRRKPGRTMLAGDRWSSMHTVTVLDALFLTGRVQDEYPYPCQWAVLLLHR